MPSRMNLVLFGVWLLVGAVAGAQEPSPPPPDTAPPLQSQTTPPEPAPGDAVLAGVTDPQLRLLLADVLENNPQLAVLEAQARTAAARAPQVRALPDPVAGLTAFLLSPETRVGPQQAAVSLSQHLPWFGKLQLREQAALADAAAASARHEAERLRLLTETRRQYYELAFADASRKVVASDRTTLGHYEELARTRYASGAGIEEDVVKLQAEITRDDARLLDIDTRQAALTATINALRDRPAATPVRPGPVPELPELHLDHDSLRAQAFARRPEIAAADAEIQAAQSQVDLAGKAYDPDVTVGLSYVLVGRRSDPPGLANPPEGNGQDILGLSAAVNLPVHRERLAAGLEEATSRRLAATEARRQVEATIEQSLGDLTSRIPLTWERLELFSSVLAVQARQALASAEAGYAAGNLSALDLLDAERVLLEVRIATERARADYAIALAQLEGAVGAPLASGQGD